MTGLRRHLVFTHIGARPARLPSVQPAPTETVYLDTYRGSVTTAGVLELDRAYSVIVTGTVSDWNAPLPEGTPEGDATYPTQHEKRLSTQVGIDAATLFAKPAGSTRPFGTWQQLERNLHDGANWLKLVPIGGPFTTPQPGHRYRYELVGKGQPVSFRWHDIDLTDNYGMLRIEVTALQVS